MSMTNLGQLNQDGFISVYLPLFDGGRTFQAVSVGNEQWLTFDQKHCAAPSGHSRVIINGVGTTRTIDDLTYERISNVQVLTTIKNSPCGRFSGTAFFNHETNNPYVVDIAPATWLHVTGGSDAKTWNSDDTVQIAPNARIKVGDRVKVREALEATINSMGFGKVSARRTTCPQDVQYLKAESNATATTDAADYRIERLGFYEPNIVENKSTYQGSTLRIDTDSLSPGLYFFKIYEILSDSRELVLDGDFTIL